MVHLDNGWDVNQQLTWYANVLTHGPLSLCDIDEIAVSHYPFYNPSATFANLNHTLHTLASTYPDKQIVVAETDYPALCTKPAYAFPPDAAWIPISAEGQATWIDNIGDIVRSTPRGVGVVYCEAAWVVSSSLGSSCKDAILVDWETDMEGWQLARLP